MGAGYEYMDQAMHGQFLWQTLVALALLKVLATSLSISSGAPGGMFAPTLFIGAMVGAAVGTVAASIFSRASPVRWASYALVGMGTLFAGFLRAPMTSVFMVLEVSGNYSIILPVMISNTIAYLIGRRFQPTPIFDVMTREDGLGPALDGRGAGTDRAAGGKRHAPAGGPDPESLRHRGGRGVARRGSADMTEDPLLVSYETGRWTRYASRRLQDLPKSGKGGHTLRDVLPAGRLPRLHPDQPLDLALRLLRDSPVSSGGASRGRAAPDRHCFRSTIFSRLTGGLPRSRSALPTDREVCPRWIGQHIY